MSILIKNAENHKEIYIEEGKIKEFNSVEADTVIDAKGKVILPGFCNTHTHAAMALLRSWADDLPLFPWLDKQWELEKNFDENKIYVGSKLAILEMIKTGTTCFMDMYPDCQSTAKACEEMMMRSFLGWPVIDEDKTTQKGNPLDNARKWMKYKSDLVTPMVACHAVYSTNKENLMKAKEISPLINIHLSETKLENENCVKEHGKSPTQYLDELGFLDARTFAAHCCWVDDKDIQTLKEKKVNVVHNPCSNMKLGSGVMPYEKMQGVNVCLGTDGAASNNNLDMLEEVKFAALMQKVNALNATVMPAKEALALTWNGYTGLNVNNQIQENAVADLILVDLSNPELTPNYDLEANLVYSANGSCVDTTIINGKIVMQNRIVPGEEKILEAAAKAAQELI